MVRFYSLFAQSVFQAPLWKLILLLLEFPTEVSEIISRFSIMFIVSIPSYKFFLPLYMQVGEFTLVEYFTTFSFTRISHKLSQNPNKYEDPMYVI